MRMPSKKKQPSKNEWYSYPVRRGQLISPFGIGAMIDFPGESVMVAGLDEWPEADCPEVHDERLATRLGVEKLRLPPAKPDETSGEGAEVPAVRFPLWHQCPRCKSLAELSWNAYKFGHCERCKVEKRKWVRLVPLRFAVACDAGHITDFPWLRWAHKKSGQKLSEVTVCSHPHLKLYSTDRADLGGLYVKCVGCDSGRSMAGASSEQGIYGFECPGHRPWLGPNGGEKCGRPAHMIQRGASNVYFAEVVSSILIPPFSSRYNLLRKQEPTLWAMLTSDLNPAGEPSPEMVKKIVASSAGLDAAKLVDFVRLCTSGKLKGSPDQPESEYRLAEYKALCKPEEQEDEQFSATACERSRIGDGVAPYIEQLVRVDRLAETRAMVGLSRLDGPTVRGCLSIEWKNWLPANRVYGEGIFLTLDEKRLEKWSAQKAVADRAAILTERNTQVQGTRKRGRARFLPPKFYLLHTLAHVLIRQLSFECGYGSSSLRERIYCNEDDGTGVCMSGMLIYTAAGDCEGTLGGLVRQTEPETFGRLVKDALQAALWCSADPLCIESKGQGADSLNLASCYACSLLPETSCEEGNRLLDRAFLIGTTENPGIGFFSDLMS
jgi:hypothetical protein